ncbi:MAG: MOSC domain-containing protein [Gemmatimonadetes bacterium]|nr:MOSC domain-containing protein [Gemmatimonadota bacterium]
MPRVESIQTGQPRTSHPPATADSPARSWTSAIWKEPVHGRVWAGFEGLDGDAQVNRRVHGGPERALLGYSASHYPGWRAEWGTKALGPGGFGENLTISGLDESTVAVGDIYQLGSVRLEVSGPRMPCANLERRHGRPGLIARVNETARSGWYLRVKVEGWLEAGVDVVLLDRPYPQWPIIRASRVYRERAERRDEARLLAGCPALLADWRAKLG